MQWKLRSHPVSQRSLLSHAKTIFKSVGWFKLHCNRQLLFVVVTGNDSLCKSTIWFNKSDWGTVELTYVRTWISRTINKWQGRTTTAFTANLKHHNSRLCVVYTSTFQPFQQFTACFDHLNNIEVTNSLLLTSAVASTYKPLHWPNLGCLQYRRFKPIVLLTICYRFQKWD